MYSGPEIEKLLAGAGVTHVVWIPDTTTGAWEEAFEASSSIRLVRVCREGEAWPLAAGLYLGGAWPLIIMQITGFYESGDAMRSVMIDMRLPLVALIGIRGYRNRKARDSAMKLALPMAIAWNVPFDMIWEPGEKLKLVERLEAARCDRRGGLVLMPEGSS